MIGTFNGCWFALNRKNEWVHYEFWCGGVVCLRGFCKAAELDKRFRAFDRRMSNLHVGRQYRTA